ncbi:MAG: hypothetical protein P4L55_15225 [Syntrophobacteraceae bacterium]|nr:hypothetical protein [Syntrophobacteraceae bacterium]
MRKYEIPGSLPLVFLAMLLLLLSSVSCTPLLIGEAACGGTLLVSATTQQTAHLNKDFVNTYTTFNNALIFEEYNQAAGFVSREYKDAFWSEVDRFKKGLRLAQFELKDMKLDKEKKHATLILTVQYWRTECPTVKTASITQKWQYFDKDKKWEVNDSGFEAIPSNSH